MQMGIQLKNRLCNFYKLDIVDHFDQVLVMQFSNKRHTIIQLVLLYCFIKFTLVVLCNGQHTARAMRN